MHIKFNRVTLHNFMSFGHSVVEFNDDGFVLVSGVNENPDDSATSNGSGKSSLWESIIWAITGDTIRGTKQVVNMFGDDGTYVELDFDIDTKHYSLLRSKDHKQYKTMLKIIIDGQDCSGKGIRDSEKLLQEYLPDITASLLGSVVILGQGLPQKFSNNSPSGRKEVLEKLSKSDFMIEDLKAKVSARKTELSGLLRNCQDETLKLTSRRTFVTDEKSKSQSELSAMDLTSLQHLLEAAKSNYDSSEKSLHAVQEELLTTTNSLNESTALLVELTNQQHAEIEKVKQSFEQIRIPVSNVKSDLLVKIGSINTQLKQIANIRDVCPTCGQSIVGVVKPDTTELVNELHENQRLLAEADNKLSSIDADEKLEMMKSSDVFTARITEEKSKVDLLRRKQSELQQQVTTRQHECDQYRISVVECKSKLDQFNTRKDTLVQNIDNYAKELESISADLLYYSNEESTINSRLEIISKFETALKRDFRGYLLKNIIEYIQLRAKNYCKTIFETDKIGFCIDGNNIEITYLDKPYENLSGGEKQKIDLIIQFSIRDMLCNHLGFTSNILVLDEIFDGLDNIGCQRVLDVIASFSDIKNIFIVTHRKDLSVPYDKELVVYKSKEGISEIK